MLILIVTGTPWSLPCVAPCASARSAARAATIACALRSTTIALIAGLAARIRSRWARTTSSALTRRSRIAPAVSTADHCQIGVTIFFSCTTWRAYARCEEVNSLSGHWSRLVAAAFAHHRASRLAGQRRGALQCPANKLQKRIGRGALGVLQNRRQAGLQKHLRDGRAMQPPAEAMAARAYTVENRVGPRLRYDNTTSVGSE